MTGDTLATLAGSIAELAAFPPGTALPDSAANVIADLLHRLEEGEVRAAEREHDGRWRAVPWVKQGILVAFRFGKVVALHPNEAGAFSFFDKHTLPTRRLTLRDGVRVVPGGSTIRAGAYVAPGVVCMPPMYINVGAHVGTGTMVDSHALIGSCAQVGERVHVSAAAQIGGVLEPINAAPVVIEDDVIVGGNCGVYEGTVVRERAVLGAGVVLTASTAIVDVRGSAPAELRGAVPPRAVVIPGTRPKRFPAGEFGVPCALIIGERSDATDRKTSLNDALREFGVPV